MSLSSLTSIPLSTSALYNGSSGGNNTDEPIEFPIIRKECLGECKFIKMRRYTLGAECKLCSKVYTSFSWKKNPKDTTYQRTIICPVCAITKNLCQVTVVDLDYDIPAYIRDSINLSSSTGHITEGNTNSAFSGQKSNVTSVYFASQAEKLLSEGGTNRHLLRNELANRNVLNELRSNDINDYNMNNDMNGGNNITDGAGDGTTTIDISTSTSNNNVVENLDYKTLQIGPINKNINETSDDFIEEKTLLEYLIMYATAGGMKGTSTRTELKDYISQHKFIPSHYCLFVTFLHQGDAELCMQKIGKKNGKFKFSGQELNIKFARKKTRYEPYSTVGFKINPLK